MKSNESKTVEEWRSISGFDNYEVSNLGNVRNLGGSHAKCGKPGGFRVVKACVLKPFIAKGTGYLQIILPDRKKHSVHRLVGIAFVPGFADDLVINHMNSIKTDNRAENLEWVTHSYNLSHPYRVMGVTHSRKGRLGINAQKITAIIGVNINTGETKNWDCASDAVREMGFQSSSISRCCTGKSKSHHGWKFHFPDGVNGYPKKTSLGRDAQNIDPETGEINPDYQP